MAESDVSQAEPDSASFQRLQISGDGPNVAGPQRRIESKHDSLGGDAGFLGRQAIPRILSPTAVEGAGGSKGYYVQYEHGAIYYTASTGPCAISGEIWRRWMSIGGPKSWLGWPTTDDKATPDEKCRYNHFALNGASTGSIYCTPGKGARIIRGDIWRKWNSIGREAAKIGYPVTDETATPDGWGRYVDFGFDGVPSASIYWNQHQGAYVISGAIWAQWQSVGGYGSNYGLPVIDETPVPGTDCRYIDFSKYLSLSGSIYWTPSGGAKMIYGQIWLKWKCLGGHAGPLGYPTTDELVTGDHGGRYNYFSNGGAIYFSWTSGAHVMLDKVPQTLSWRFPDLVLENGTGKDSSFELTLGLDGRVTFDCRLRNLPSGSDAYSLAVVVSDADNVAWIIGFTAVPRERSDQDGPATVLQFNHSGTSEHIAGNWLVLAASAEIRFRAHKGGDWKSSADAIIHGIRAAAGVASVQSLLE
jgi:LGFP repeat